MYAFPRTMISSEEFNKVQVYAKRGITQTNMIQNKIHTIFSVSL
jgi:hypothetical protein